MTDETSSTCTCGDDEGEHGNDPEYQGSTACNVEGCDCIAFESEAGPR